MARYSVPEVTSNLLGVRSRLEKTRLPNGQLNLGPDPLPDFEEDEAAGQERLDRELAKYRMYFDRYDAREIPPYSPNPGWLTRFRENPGDLIEALALCRRESGEIFQGTATGAAVFNEHGKTIGYRSLWVVDQEGRTVAPAWSREQDDDREVREQWYAIQPWYLGLVRLIALWSDVVKTGIDTNPLLAHCELMSRRAPWRSFPSLDPLLDEGAFSASERRYFYFSADAVFERLLNLVQLGMDPNPEWSRRRTIDWWCNFFDVSADTLRNWERNFEESKGVRRLRRMPDDQKRAATRSYHLSTLPAHYSDNLPGEIPFLREHLVTSKPKTSRN